jgi:hypothetical protein
MIYLLNIFMFRISCGTVALMVLCQFSDICGGPQISENWPRSANIIKLAKDNKGYVSAGPQISENWPRTIRATVPQLVSYIVTTIYTLLHSIKTHDIN